jgi:deoxyribodipyrimidine photo-lyase
MSSIGHEGKLRKKRNEVKKERVRMLNDKDRGKGPVIYWMSRDQRAADNWALLFAQELALEQKVPLEVIFCLVPVFLQATIRPYDFMLRGLEETEKNLADKNISFFLLKGSPGKKIPEYVRKSHAGALVTDFDPLKIKRKWRGEILPQLSISFYEVDGHNLIPCWAASPKQEFAAYTFRPKVKKRLQDFMDPFPSLKKHPFTRKIEIKLTDWVDARKSLMADTSVPAVDWIEPGEKAAHRMLRYFMRHKLTAYNTQRNDPNCDVSSNFSPYLHFGQISAQRIAQDVRNASAPTDAREAFLEELIVRRELADNYCFYNKNYDNFRGFPDWAKKTLAEHRRDKREYEYMPMQFEKGLTHDELWNAAQMEMVKTGKMHGYMRMYWAKKILEWTKSPEEAQKIAIALNDKYEIDGRDPNGYTGIAWSIGGVHDRAWFSRPVFGKVRYMSFRGARSKFDVKAYIAKVERL